MKKVLRALYHYFLFFSLVAVMVSCSMTLFVRAFSDDLGIELTGENLDRAAKMTFVCVILMSLLFTVIDVVRRKLTTERITKRIASATRELVAGNFDVRISPSVNLATDENYGEIIDCFNKIAKELGGLETLREDFIANVSHEMKTPLAVMQNYGTLLSAPELDDGKRLEYAKGVSDGARRMADMMTNILKLNRLENQQIYPQASVFDLGEQLRESLLCYEGVWERENISIDTDIADGVNVCADKELLGLVWSNLLSNAFKFTSNGGSVFLGLEANGENVSVKVSDTGCGMTSDVGKHIFEKFYQGDTSRATQGNGLGLALVKRVVDILNGEISVESEVGVGSVFTVTLPRNGRWN